MPAVHAHAVDLAGQGKEALQEMVRRRMRERFRSSALAKLQAAGAGPSSYDLVLSLLVGEKKTLRRD